MYKETIISIIIIIIILIGDFVTQKYTEKSVQEITSKFEELKQNLREENEEESNEIAKEIEKNLNDKHAKLAYFIEHDELEKVETDFTTCHSFVQSKNYDLAISQLDKTVYVLEHITDKYSFNLENVF